MINTVTVPATNVHGKRSWVARITGVDPKTVYSREFVEPTVTQVGLYEASHAKDNRRRYAALRAPNGDLVLTIQLLPPTFMLLMELLTEGRLKDVEPFKDEDGDWMVKRPDGTINMRKRTGREALLDERKRLAARLAEIDAQLSA